MRTHRRRRVLPVTLRAVLGLVLALIVGGAAFAYWTTLGRGSASAGSGTVAVLTVSSGTPTASLYPGGTASVAAKLTNPGSTQVKVSSLALATTEGTTGFDVDAAHSDCGLDSLSFTTATNAGTGWIVPANGSTNVALTSSLAMDASADNECQGATFTVHLRVAS